MCTACPANTYKTTLGDHKCSACPLNTVSPPGSKRLTDCVCKPGYFSIKGPGVACDQCPEYTWKNMTGSERCSSCPANTRSPAGSLNLSDCVCLKGYYGPDGQACSACSFGSYKSEVGSGPCLSCPYANMTSPAGSLDREECVCNAGYQMTNDGTCIACPAGKYKESEGSDDCVDCFAHSNTSLPGSTSPFQCTCDNGYEPLRVGISCQNIDECVAGTHNCAASAQCFDTPGGFYCDCRAPLYSGNGTTCFPESSVVQITYRATSHVQDLADGHGYVHHFAELLGLDVSDISLQLQPQYLNTSVSNDSGFSSSQTVSLVPQNRTLFIFTARVGSDSVGMAVHAADNLTKFNQLLQTSSYSPPLLLMASIETAGRLVAACGNGVLELGESCDDANTHSGDGCSSACQVETGWTCDTESSNVSNCRDINECDVCRQPVDSLMSASTDAGALCSTLSRCSSRASCINTNGSYLCVCRPGFVGDGLFCGDDTRNNDTQQFNVMFSSDPVQILRAGTAGRFANSSLLNFGIAVALSQSMALVGSESSEEALLFERGLEREWSPGPTHVFLAPDDRDPAHNGKMNAVSLHVTPGLDQVPRSFNQYTVRASCAAIGTSSGDVYIYHKEPGMPWDSTPRAILQAGSASELFFGAALALSSEELLVGVPGAHLALIFRRPMRDRSGFTRPWPHEAAFRLDGHQDIVMLGQSVALSATHAAVGSHASARVVAFERRGDGTWPNAGVVLHPVAETPFQSFLVLLGIRAPYLSEFGKAVSLSDSYLFVSDPGVRAVSIFHVADNFSESGRTVLRPQAIIGEDNDAIFGDCVSGTDLFLVVGATGSNRVFIFKSYQNLSWPAAPAQTLTYASPLSALSVGAACAINNQDLLLPSVSAFSHRRGAIFVHSSACAKGFFGLSSDSCSPCPPGTTAINVTRTVTGCTCLAGTFGPGGGPCSICPRNHICPGGGSKIKCPGNTTSRNGSALASDCVTNRWLAASMSHTSNEPGADNTLTTTLSLNFGIEAEDQMLFTISGLVCGGQPCQPCATGLNVTSSSPAGQTPHTVFSGTCAVCGLTNGSLTVLHVGRTRADEIFSLSFCVSNPTEAQAAPDLSIEAHGASGLSRILITPATGSKAPLAVLGFTSAEGFQTSANQADLSLITVTLELLAVPEAGCRVRVSNLTNADNTTGTFRLRHSRTNTTQDFCDLGFWNSSAQHVVAPICSESDRPRPLTLQFELLNAGRLNLRPAVQVEILSASAGEQVLAVRRAGETPAAQARGRPRAGRGCGGN